VEPRVHHNKEVTLKLTIEVSNLNGFVEVQAGQRQPIIGTRTIASSIRLKDGETNLLAGLFRTDKSNTTNSVPFLGDIPILGRLFSKKATTNGQTDLILTLTPHIIRIPDITAADLEPFYVGTDANISAQGSPRIESPNAQGPFEFSRREPPVPRGAPAPKAPAVTPAPQILVPGGMPNDPFRPNPRDAIPPQPTPVRPGAVSQSNESVIFDFDPPSLAIAPGEQRTMVVRATGESASTSGRVEVRFDPAVAAVVAVRPIVVGAGTAEGRVEGNKVILDLPSALGLSGTHSLAEITIRGVAPGAAKLSFESAPTGSQAVVLADARVEVRAP
jgi:general secretion pathway protein D